VKRKREKPMELPMRNLPDLSTLGGRIRSVRKALGMKVVTVSEKVGISRTSWTQWESNVVANPSRDVLTEFSKIAEIDLDWLIERKGDDPEFLAAKGSSPAAGDSASGTPDILIGGRANQAVPEVSPSMAAHARAIDVTPRSIWGMPIDVLELGFNCEAAHVVMKRVITREGADFGIERNDYVLIDTSRTRMDEPGLYILADPEGICARRAKVELNGDQLVISMMGDDTDRTSPRDSGDKSDVLGRVMGIFKPV